MFGFDFAGISESGIEELKIALNKYAEEASSCIAEFNASANLASTFAGEALTSSITAALEEGKQALYALVNKLKEAEQAASQYALEQWGEGTGGVAGTVDSSASDIRAQANALNLD